MKKSFIEKLLSLKALVILLLLVATGCEKDENPEDFLGSITVQVQLKDGLGDISVENLNISLVNIQDNIEKKALTNAQGIANYESLPAGIYNINISESREDGLYYLTGSLNNIVVEMKQNTIANVTVDAVNPEANFVIKEVYHPGAADAYVSMFKDQFLEIFNNSSETLYADSLYIACLFPERPQTSEAPLAASHDITKFVYAEMIERVPGNGKQYPIEPGKSFVIALNAINFKEGNPNADKAVDNSNADFERYGVDWLEAQGRTANKFFDFDNPDVPNMTNIFMSEKHSIFIMEINGPSIVIFRSDKEFDSSDVYDYNYTTAYGSPAEVNLVKIPVENIIDGIDIMENSTLGDWKRLPTSIDASFTYLKADGGSFYSSQSTRRKVDEVATAKFGRVVLQDTNNSNADFETLDTPDPKGYDNL